MVRRTSSPSLFLALLVLVALALGSLGTSAAETPTVLNPTDAGYSAADRSAILDAVTALEAALREGRPIPSFRLIGRGWTERDFVLYTAGRIEASGFEVRVVEGEDADGANRFWILVGVPLEGERMAWIPVEASPWVLTSTSALGQIPWAGSRGSSYDPAYAQFDHVLELTRNVLPTVQFIAVGHVEINETTNLHATARDSDGTIVAYIWYVDGAQVAVETDGIYEYVFNRIGDVEVTLRVIDNRGGEASATRTLDVEEESNCGCH